MKKIVFLVFFMAATAFSQDVQIVLERSHVSIGIDKYHGTPKRGRYTNDLTLTYTLTYPLTLKSVHALENALKKAKKLEVSYVDDQGKRRTKTYLGAMPKVKDEMADIEKFKKLKKVKK
uniref:Uncharacterized protein n=1 Tax=viral metagenome TaxID=1070528 RepID=A0A6H1ZHD3_9ZZZZ